MYVFHALSSVPRSGLGVQQIYNEYLLNKINDGGSDSE